MAEGLIFNYLFIKLLRFFNHITTNQKDGKIQKPTPMDDHPNGIYAIRNI